MNTLSLGATFGALVWIFQDGHLASLLGFTAFGAIEAWIPVIVFAFAFGLSMDYEVFVFLGFASGQTMGIKEFGLAIAVAVAVAVDATLVRCILVPATMTLLGSANWWAPTPLRRLHQRLGLHEAPAHRPVPPARSSGAPTNGNRRKGGPHPFMIHDHGEARIPTASAPQLAGSRRQPGARWHLATGNSAAERIPLRTAAKRAGSG